MDKCPKCGAKPRSATGFDGYQDFSCGSYVYKKGEPLIESVVCLRNQLTALHAKYRREIKWLEESQWTKEAWHGGRLCACCGWRDLENGTNKHAPDCELAAILAEAEAENG